MQGEAATSPQRRARRAAVAQGMSVVDYANGTTCALALFRELEAAAHGARARSSLDHDVAITSSLPGGMVPDEDWQRARATRGTFLHRDFAALSHAAAGLRQAQTSASGVLCDGSGGRSEGKPPRFRRAAEHRERDQAPRGIPAEHGNWLRTCAAPSLRTGVDMGSARQPYFLERGGCRFSTIRPSPAQAGGEPVTRGEPLPAKPPQAWPASRRCCGIGYGETEIEQ